MAERRFWVYILANGNKSLYIGVTNNLERRVYEHKTGADAGFTAKYGIRDLMWYGEFHDPREAIEFEKKLKGKSRAKKIILIEKQNPHWNDLALDWFADVEELAKSSSNLQPRHSEEA